MLKEVSLDSIGDGVAQELFAHELAKVAMNIADMNTPAKTKRTITLTFEFQPDELREEVRVLINAKTKTAAVKPYGKTVHIGKQNGKVSLFGQDTRQINMFDNGVTSIPERGAGNA